mmetsp:Transcript_4891/g.20934  ORF Transcript_4891/g.20934 Transcript_4891/m.20934 type:complete len:243 (-) Transcript_4891:533-1261(-)
MWCMSCWRRSDRAPRDAVEVEAASRFSLRTRSTNDCSLESASALPEVRRSSCSVSACSRASLAAASMAARRSSRLVPSCACSEVRRSSRACDSVSAAARASTRRLYSAWRASTWSMVSLRRRSRFVTSSTRASWRWCPALMESLSSSMSRESWMRVAAAWPFTAPASSSSFTVCLASMSARRSSSAASLVTRSISFCRRIAVWLRPLWRASAACARLTSAAASRASLLRRTFSMRSSSVAPL